MAPACFFGLIGYVTSEPDNVNTVALESVSSSITVRGFVAHIKSTLLYRNATQQPLQVLFKTPVDEGAALYHVQAKLEGRTIVAQCLEKKKAEKVYNDAVEAGQTAVLVREESQTADIINLALGNLPAGSECEIELSLVCELRVGSDGGVQFTLPTVLNPRYQPASSTGPDQHLVSDVSAVATATKPYTIEVSATVSGALDIARIISHSDPINVVIEDDKKTAKISQDGGYRSDHEWSFVVHYNNPYAAQVLVETGDPTATGLMKDSVVMINMFPELSEGSYSHFNEVMFVVDRSGSMGGENIRNARAVLLLFLKSLPPGCRFNIVSFGSSHFFLFKEGSRVYSEETLAEACALHDKMDADMGGTEILEPLKAIYSQTVDPEYSRQILLLTDGAVWNVDQVTELAARHASNTRVFTVGIGEGASTALVKGLAKAGRGRAEIVTERDRVSSKVMGLVASMLQASVREVNVSCQLETPTRLSLVPPEPPVIFAGQHLITFARMPPGSQLKGVTLKGKVEGREWQSGVSGAQVVSVHDANFSLHRLAARAAILHLCLHEQDEARDSVVELSTASGVLSRYTALVAVDQDGKTVKRQLPPPPPCVQPENAGYPQMAPCMGFATFCAPAQKSLRSAGLGNMLLRGGGCVPHTKFRCPASPPMPVFLPGYAKSEVTSRCLIADATDSVTYCADSSPHMFYNESMSEKEDMASADVFEEIIAHQKFDGSWEAADLASVLEISVDELAGDDQQAAASAVFVTSVVVALLQENFKDRAPEWNLLVTKAMNFLKKNSTEAPEQLLKAAKEHLEKLRSKYPFHAVIAK